MAHGVESRAPFLKPSFVSWVNSVPMTYKYNRNMKTNKLVLRKYMANYLHPNIVGREKIGFGSDFDQEYKMKEFQKKIISIISERDSFTSTYLNSEAILKIFKYKKLIYKYHNIIKHILNIEIWYKVFYRKNYFKSL